MVLSFWFKVFVLLSDVFIEQSLSFRVWACPAHPRRTKRPWATEELTLLGRRRIKRF